jgi:hypothetical protein
MIEKQGKEIYSKLNTIKKLFNKKYIFLSLLIVYTPLFKYYIFLNNNKGHSFLTSDWLINYKYGFINRGLIGTLFFTLIDNPKLMLQSISIVLITIYILIFYYLNQTYYSYNQNLVSVILIFSPAVFLFPIYDSQGSFRKEILGILSVFILASCLNTPKNFKIYLSSLVYTIAIFSHTVNFFFLTTILYLLFKVKKTKQLIHYLVYIFPTVANLSIYYLFSPTEPELFSIRDDICSDLRDADLFNLCGHGSFDYVTWDLNAAYLITQNIVINERRAEYYFYIILFCVSLIPFLFDKKIIKLSPNLIVIGFSFIPLFLLAYDWGRWINIMLTCFMIVYLTSKNKDKNSYLSLFLIPFPILFRIEHCCGPTFDFGLDFILGNINYLIQNLMNIFTSL